MSLLDHDGMDPNHAADNRVRHETSQYITAYWDPDHDDRRRAAMIAEIMELLCERQHPAVTVTQLVVRAAERIAYREEHG